MKKIAHPVMKTMEFIASLPIYPGQLAASLRAQRNGKLTQRNIAWMLISTVQKI